MHKRKVPAETALERLIFLSDGVFAIAITLLVLEIKVPELPEQQLRQQLPSILLGLWHSILTYALSFLIIGLYWATHQRLFHFLVRANAPLIWLNILFLMSVAFLPIPTDILALYNDHQAAVIFYAVSVSVVGMWTVLLWSYATYNHHLVEKDLDASVIAHHLHRALVEPIIFIGSIALCIVSPYLAEASWTLVFVATYLLERRYRRNPRVHDAQLVKAT